MLRRYDHYNFYNVIGVLHRKAIARFPITPYLATQYWQNIGKRLSLEKLSSPFMQLLRSLKSFLYHVFLHVSFSRQREVFLSITNLTHTTAVYVVPSKHQAWHIVYSFMHHNCPTTDATPQKLDFFKPQLDELLNDIQLQILSSVNSKIGGGTPKKPI